ncbi:hypothetical protein B0H13DRAFT_1885734 [Mycena leptocephala]|nr:hypothetical protein B0H13DRAFT_1885734 [Mycena leptocephala]
MIKKRTNNTAAAVSPSASPFYPDTSSASLAGRWARKYGIRVNLHLHTIPGSQNDTSYSSLSRWLTMPSGYNRYHSGKRGQIGFLNGIMGVANAQRSLDYIRIFAEFISQPDVPSDYRTRPAYLLAWGSSIKTSRSAFGVAVAGEFSNGYNDCGLYLTGVNGTQSYGGNRDLWMECNATVKDCFKTPTVYADWRCGRKHNRGVCDRGVWAVAAPNNLKCARRGADAVPDIHCDGQRTESATLIHYAHRDWSAATVTPTRRERVVRCERYGAGRDGHCGMHLSRCLECAQFSDTYCTAQAQIPLIGFPRELPNLGQDYSYSRTFVSAWSSLLRPSVF